MAIFKCKMCGGTLEINADVTVAECEYCGSKQTIPSKKDEIVTNLFNRANNLRIKNEFDKAAEVYNKILNENDSEAEAHWGLVLCKYGIEYVEDPKTYKRIPTCHRTQYVSVLSDADYLAATENADAVSRELYVAQAHEIAELQKSILAIVKDEKPFDVFICYKETDESGKRTIDSTIANDIYYQLTKEGLRVFYSAITLEDKLGVEYEPYIFAALNSAKVMLVIGTRPEYFNAVWVKNEWSRYLAIMKNDREKLLIPCYRDMDAYDLPEEFAHLQAQDMSKIGFINDVVRGIGKVVVKDEPKKETVVKEVVKETVTSSAASANPAPLLKRAFMFLEDGDWHSADEYAEKVLDIDPECAEGYLVKLMAELKVQKKEKLKDCSVPFNNLGNYTKAVRFGSKELKAELEGYIRSINERNRLEAERRELERLTGIYNDGISKFKAAKTEDDFRKAEKIFKSIPEFRDSAEYIKHCGEKAEESRKDAIYDDACGVLSDTHNGGEKIPSLHKAIASFQSLNGWRDSKAKIMLCEEKIKEINLAEEKRKAEEKAEQERKAKELAEAKKKTAKRNKIIAAVIAVAVAISLVVTLVIIPAGNKKKYGSAVALMESGEYYKAIDIFTELGTFEDSVDKVSACKLSIASELKDAGNFDEAIALLKEIEDYSSSKSLIVECNYSKAVKLFEEGEYEKALEAYELAGNYLNAELMIVECNYLLLEKQLEGATTVEAAIALGKFAAKEDYHPAREKSLALWGEITLRETVSAGGDHTLGVKSDGTVVAVGRGFYGRNQMNEWTDIVAISVGSDDHAVGLKSNGTVVFEGTEYYGRCDVEDWRDIVAVSAGERHTVGLKADGTVVAVGDNDDGECNVSGWTDVIAISAGNSHTVGLKSDGTVVAVGSNEDDQCNVDEWTDIVAISAGYNHTVGLKSDGTVVTVGSDYGDLFNVDEWTDIVAVSAGSSNTIGLKSDGTVVAVGSNSDGKCNVEGWTDIVAVSAGSWHTVGLKSDGTVVAVGYNTYGQCDVDEWSGILTGGPATQEPAVDDEKQYNTAMGLKNEGKTAEAAIAFGKCGDYKDAKGKSFALWNEIAARETVSAGNDHTVAIKSDGTVVSVGSDSLERRNVSGWKNIVDVSAQDFNTVGLRADGTVVVAGSNSNGECDVEAWKDIVAVSEGDSWTVGLKSDGTVVAVGDNSYDQCNITGWTDIVAISTGHGYTVGLKSDGTVVSVGRNSSVNLGVAEWTDIIAISAKDYHTVGLKADGTVVAVGDNDHGQCDVEGWNDIIAVSAGTSHTIGLKADGTVVASGNNDYGQGDTSDLTNIAAISAGDFYTVFLKSDGRVIARGSNYSGECDVEGWKNIRLP